MTNKIKKNSKIIGATFFVNFYNNEKTAKVRYDLNPNFQKKLL